MANPSEILSSPEYLNANEETKKAIFDKHIATDPSYSDATPETQQAIQQRFGVVGKEKSKEPTSAISDIMSGNLSNLSVGKVTKGVDELTEVGFGKGPEAKKNVLNV